MGERSNIKFKQESASIWLYGHWAGPSLANMLKHGLIAARPRWNDESYGTRIVVANILSGTEGKETGWGLSTYPQDNQYDVLEVDFSMQTVRVLSRDGYHTATKDNPWPATTLREWSFEEYVALDDAAKAAHGERA